VGDGVVSWRVRGVGTTTWVAVEVGRGVDVGIDVGVNVGVGTESSADAGTARRHPRRSAIAGTATGLVVRSMQ
jgi:hypothetical protein